MYNVHDAFARARSQKCGACPEALINRSNIILRIHRSVFCTVGVHTSYSMYCMYCMYVFVVYSLGARVCLCFMQFWCMCWCVGVCFIEPRKCVMYS